MVQRKSIKKQTVKICLVDGVSTVILKIKLRRLIMYQQILDFKPFLQRAPFIVSAVEGFGNSALPLHRTGCGVLSVFRQASQSGKWLGKASSFISQLVSSFVCFGFLDGWQPGLQHHVFLLSDGTATLKRSMCLNPLLSKLAHTSLPGAVDSE